MSLRHFTEEGHNANEYNESSCHLKFQIQNFCIRFLSRVSLANYAFICIYTQKQYDDLHMPLRLMHACMYIVLFHIFEFIKELPASMQPCFLHSRVVYFIFLNVLLSLSSEKGWMNVPVTYFSLILLVLNYNHFRFMSFYFVLLPIRFNISLLLFSAKAFLHGSTHHV